jgi:D-alanyl-D-alanine carboxypeptidase (penicillin-binding protein 5/6)
MRRALAVFLACLAFASAVARAADLLNVTPPPVAARAFLLVDAMSGKALASAGADERMEPGSLTKLMTECVVLDAIRAGTLALDRSVNVSAAAAAAPGGRMFLSPGQSAAVADLLKGLVVLTANDAALALAEAVATTEAAFVERMNTRAERLGLKGTHFANATGEPAPGHHTTARDLAAIASVLLNEYPEHYALHAQRELTWNGIKQSSRNRLLWTDASVDGMQTGFTESGAYGLVSSAKRGERRLLAVVLGAQSDTLRMSETQKLLNFGFQAWETRRLYKRGQSVATPPVYKGTSDTVSLGFDRDVWLTLPRERFGGLRAALETRQPFVAPLAAGQKAGIMKLMRESTPVAEFPVVALEEIPVAGFLSRGWDTLKLLFLSP